MTGAEREACTVMAAMLHAQRTLAHLGLLLTVVVSAVAMSATLLSVEIQTHALAGVVAALLLGATERYFAFRLRLDEHLFNALATGELASTTSMDEALVRLGLLCKDKGGRTLPQRLKGAAALCNKHRALVFSQWVAVLGFAFMQVF